MGSGVDEVVGTQKGRERRRRRRKRSRRERRGREGGGWRLGFSLFHKMLPPRSPLLMCATVSALCVPFERGDLWLPEVT